MKTIALVALWLLAPAAAALPLAQGSPTPESPIMAAEGERDRICFFPKVCI